MFQFIKGTEVLGGLLLLCNRFVPLALALEEGLDTTVQGAEARPYP